ncbi:MAG: DUF4230 domain-containing protein [Chitinophagales bacterium]|nr:DUF4230 domain-containing protein [Chitinophagales bacterium]
MKDTVYKILIVVLVAILLHFALLQPLSNALKKQTHETVSSTVILKEVEKVFKLVTVEGNFSELMNYEDYAYVDLPGFRKKAIIKVQGKVLVGYDLKKLQLSTNEEDHTILLKELPEPEILSVESDLSYYDISEGIFNTFSKDELNKLNKKAKDILIQKANEAHLREQAKQEGNQILEILDAYTEKKGWKLTYNKPIQPLQKN